MDAVSTTLPLASPAKYRRAEAERNGVVVGIQQAILSPHLEANLTVWLLWVTAVTNPRSDVTRQALNPIWLPRRLLQESVSARLQRTTVARRCHMALMKDCGLMRRARQASQAALLLELHLQTQTWHHVREKPH